MLVCVCVLREKTEFMCVGDSGGFWVKKFNGI